MHAYIPIRAWFRVCVRNDQMSAFIVLALELDMCYSVCLCMYVCVVCKAPIHRPRGAVEVLSAWYLSTFAYILVCIHTDDFVANQKMRSGVER